MTPPVKYFFQKKKIYTKNVLTALVMRCIIQTTNISVCGFIFPSRINFQNINLISDEAEGDIIRKNCIIYDVDEVYVYRLMNYLKAKSSVPYEIIIFTEREAIWEYLQENGADVLLSNDEDILSWGKERGISKVLKLSEEQISANLCESVEYHSIFKYQSTEKLVKEMLSYCMEGFRNPDNEKRQGVSGRIIGVYAPVGRCYKTTFSLALADALSKNGRVLYLNLEEYTGLSDGIFKSSAGSLSEIMYMYRRMTTNLSHKIREMTGTINQFDYIPPVEYPEDVVEVLTEEWITFFEFVINNVNYDYLVVDLGNLVKKPWQFFEIMDVVFVPEIEDIMGKKKIKEFVEILKNTGRGILLENLAFINIPYDSELKKGGITMGKIEWSAVGSFARKVVNERGL